MTEPDDPPEFPSNSRRLATLENQATTILILSGVNLFANIATIAVAVVAAWP